MTPLAHMLTRYWQLDQAQARRWWQAVCRARWSAVRDWRQTVYLFDQQVVRPLSDAQAVDAVQRFLATSASPAQVLAVVDNLVREAVLTRQDARQIERKVLARVSREGQWL